MQERSSRFLDKMKDNANHFFDKLHISKHRIIEILIATGIGFACGFLLKRYANYVGAFILFLVLLIILQKFELIHVVLNDAKIEEFFGIKTTGIAGDFFSMCWEWIRINAVVTFSFIMGLLIGLKRA